MNLREYQHLLAERATVKKLLDEMPEALIIDRMSMTSRLEMLDEQIAAIPAPNREPARARLTFRGKPVIGAQGVFAEFGANAVSSFTKAVATLGASLNGALGERGRLKNQDNFQLLITGTALGSFGFEFEEPPLPNQGTLFPDERDTELALRKTFAILDALPKTDEELTEALTDADDRAVKRLREFLDVLTKDEAVCALEFGGRTARFLDVGQVRRCAARLSPDNIKEETIELLGRFQGVLPGARTFEFALSEDASVIRGKVGAEIEAPGKINAVLDQSVIAKLRKRQVGEGRPRFTLLSYALADTESTDV